LREDERIPPYVGANAAAGRVTSFDGLAMPPVREADVFSQMSPPASSTGEDPFGNTTGSGATPAALTPMDMVRADEAPARPSRRPSPLSGRPPLARGERGFGSAPPASVANASVAPGHTESTEMDSATPSSSPPAPPPGSIEEQLTGGSRRRPPVRPAIPGTAGRTSDASKSFLDDAGISSAVVPPAPIAAPRRAAVVMGEEDFESVRQQRRRRTRWITTLLILGLLVWGGAMAAIYYAFTPSSLTQVAVKFRNFEYLSTNEARQFQDDQQKLLNLEATRIDARRILHQNDPEVANGFLDDQERYLVTTSRTSWPENRKGWMLLSYKGTADPGNRARIAAIGQALYHKNEPRVNDAKRTDQQLRDLKDAIARDEQQKQQLAQEIEQLRIQGDSAPDTRQINAIRDEVQQLEKAWGDALATVKSAEAELKRLKQEAVPGDSRSSNATAAATNTPSKDDETLAAMEAQLRDLTGKLNVAQSGKKEQADAARRALDASLQGFEQQLSNAKQLMKDSPELSAYVTAAQRLQVTTRVVIDDIIRRQEQQYGRLNELKQTLTEKMEQRRAEQLSGNPELKELNEQLATATRQLNAAKNAGMQKEADEKQEQVKLLTNMIKAKEELVPRDPAMKDFADTIAQIQQIIDTVQSNVENDRKRADQLLLDAQQTFAANAAVEKLPAAQKSVAADLEKQLAAINAARQQYNQAISATATDDDDATKQLRTQVAAIQTSIDARKKDLADAAAARTMTPDQQRQRADQIPIKEKELAELQKTEANARLAYTNREKDLRDAQAAAKSARDSLDRLTELQGKQDTLDKKLAQANRDLPRLDDQAKRAVMPEPVSEADVSVASDTDKRPVLYLGGSAVVFILFAGLMLFALHSTAVAGMPMGTASIEQMSEMAIVRPTPAPQPREPGGSNGFNGSNGTNGAARAANNSSSNGDTNGDGHHDADADDDTEPATI
jgi:hypothetical protein